MNLLSIEGVRLVPAVQVKHWKQMKTCGMLQAGEIDEEECWQVNVLVLFMSPCGKFSYFKMFKMF